MSRFGSNNYLMKITPFYIKFYQLLQSETDAEDAVAQAFLNIMEHFEKSASYHAATRFL